MSQYLSATRGLNGRRNTHLTDILVPDTADLLDVGGTLGNTLQGVTGQLELVLDVGGGDDLNAGLGSHAAHVLLTQEVTATISIRSHPPSCMVGSVIPDLNLGAAGLGVLLDVDVDGKVSVHVAHLVQEAAGDTDNQVVDEGADSTEGSDTLADTVVQLDRDHVLLGAAEGDGKVGEVLNELATGALDGHNPRTNVNLHCKERTSHISHSFNVNSDVPPPIGQVSSQKSLHVDLETKNLCQEISESSAGE